MRTIPYGRQEITEDDVRAVIDTLRSDFLTQGPKVPAFEAAVSVASQSRHAVAVNSATSALHMGALALGLGPGDRLWTSPITFVASANCGRYCGATVDFVDIDSKTYNLDPSALADKLVCAEREGTLPKVVVPVHLTGQSCDMDVIHRLSQKYGFRLMEDASHAIGGMYQGHPVGDCRFSDLTVFSFHPVKIVTTAEGGAITTNDAALAQRLTLLRSHGITRDAKLMTHEPDGPWYYQQVDLGFNYRMTDLQAALGVSQMSRLAEYVRRRHEVRRRYDDAFASLPIVRPTQHEDCYSAFHLYVIRLDPKRCKVRRLDAFERLRARGIGVNVHYIPVHLQPYYRQLGFREGMFPEAERYYAEALSLPMFATMSDEDVETVIGAVRETVQA